MAEKTPRARPVIQVRGLCKEYPLGEETVVALRDIDLTIRRGEILCIFGTSGSGKSTLLNQLAGMEKPTRGEVRIGGGQISPRSGEAPAGFRPRQLGFGVPASHQLPRLTRADKGAPALLFRGVPGPQREAAARAMLKRVGLGHRLDHYPGQMSGGQQQRAGIARAFLARPDVVFADEPTGNLDSRTTVEVMEMICGFGRDLHQTSVLGTHDPEMARCGGRIVTLIDGRIVRDEMTRSVS